MDALNGFDYAKALIWLTPGAFFTLFRSFAMKGSFPTIGKDDLGALVLGAVIYHFMLFAFISPDALQHAAGSSHATLFWTATILLIPSAIGFVLGLFEASDWTGRRLRSRGINVPTPMPTAWDTVFRTLRANTVMLITLKDGSTIAGRWIGGTRPSAASSDAGKADLYVGEIGRRVGTTYVPPTIDRGIYIAADQISTIEIIQGAVP